MNLETWVKPSGVEVQINPESRDAARELGWVPKEQSTQEPKRRGRPPKVREE